MGFRPHHIFTYEIFPKYKLVPGIYWVYINYEYSHHRVNLPVVFGIFQYIWTGIQRASGEPLYVALVPVGPDMRRTSQPCKTSEYLNSLINVKHTAHLPRTACSTCTAVWPTLDANTYSTAMHISSGPKPCKDTLTDL